MSSFTERREDERLYFTDSYIRSAIAPGTLTKPPTHGSSTLTQMNVQKVDGQEEYTKPELGDNSEVPESHVIKQ